MLAQIDLIRLSGNVINDATEEGDVMLRSHDAIRLASAVSIGSDLTAFVV